MKRKLKAAAQAAGDPLSQEALHFRLCHVCLFLNEAEAPIAECEACHCGFVGDTAWDASGQTGERAEDQDAEEEGMGESSFRQKRLYGLSVVW